MAFAQRPIVHPEHPRRGTTGKRPAPDELQQGGRPGPEAQAAHEPGSAFPTEREGEPAQHLRKAVGAARIRGDDLRQPLGEDAPPARRV
jgi:hypothetical protein